MSTHIASLINQSISTAIVPKVWKKPTVTPVPKSSGSSNVSNFHPISILPVLSKIFERIIHSQL